MIRSYLQNEDKDKIGFYTISNKFTLETYAGSGILGECLCRHMRGYRNGNHANSNLQEAFKRTPDGWEIHAIPIEDTNLCKEEIRELAFDIEQEIIDEFIGETPLFMNKSKNARYCRPEWTDAQREEKSVAMLGTNNHFYGKAHSKEVSEHLSSIRKDWYSKLSEEIACEINEKIRLANIKRFKDPVERKKCGAHAIGKQYALGNVLTPEHLALMHSPEAIKKSIITKQSNPNHTDICRDNAMKGARAICVNGVVYKSMTDAACMEKISIQLMYYRVNSDSQTWVAWHYV